ncbi:hypothetical protein TWF506_010204 [Arthrobotrys conoides]|uniref:Uncharacterized protein n=1 Tax=Arthrobotrys conoides TaxID=74498 RepID=A0AAN8NEN3_9PEZI
MASIHTSSSFIQIPAYPLPVGTGLLPVLKRYSHIDKVREAISNTSDKFIYNYFVSMGESAITMQLRMLAGQTGAGNFTSNRCWKTIRNTLLSEEQLLILSEHYRLREHLLPDPRKCKRWMNTSAYTSKLFLVYVAGYLQSLQHRSQLTWLNRTMIVLINGMIDECLHRRVQIGIPKLVQELPDSSMGSSSTGSKGPMGKHQSAVLSDAAEKAKPLEVPTDRPTVNQLLDCGWKYSESRVDVSGCPFWHVVLFTENMEPVSIVRDNLDQARFEAIEAAGKLYLENFT